MEFLGSSSSYFLLFLWVFLFFVLFPVSRSGDPEALLGLKSSIDPLNKLPWRTGTNFCKWEGVKECRRGRVTKLVLEHLNLTGALDENTLNQLDQLRVLSFKSNSIFGQIPNLSGLLNLKSLFLNDNHFSGNFPASISGLHRLKVAVLSGNQISGGIPNSLLKLQRLYVLYLQDNQLTGQLPPFNQTSLRFFNVSNNKLSGEIPLTPALLRFNSSSFSNNLNLCGQQIQTLCNISVNATPPSLAEMPVPASPSSVSSPPEHRNHAKLIKVIAGSIGGFILVFISLVLIWVCCKRGKISSELRNKEIVGGGEIAGRSVGGEGQSGVNNNGGRQSGFSWEAEGLGSLVFCGAEDQQMNYSLEDLLKASAETLGRGTIGSTYKAVMESGFIVTVKRLKESRFPSLDDFRKQMEVLGRLRHPNLVPLRAYFQAKEERLLVYDYFPNGSLFSLVHGSRTSGGGKPLHWTSCLKIAEDLATGLVYLHQNPNLVHGNLKSSNVLLGSDFESCLTDYGLSNFKDPEAVDEPSASSLFYRAPESRDSLKIFTQQSDVYSFGVLLLELLTGKTPFQDLVQEHGTDIPRWVMSVREEEMDSEPGSGNETSEEKLSALLNIAMACVSIAPESRPVMREVLKMIREVRAEAQVSSNSSDHSPGRWSDTIQSLPREDHVSI